MNEYLLEIAVSPDENNNQRQTSVKRKSFRFNAYHYDAYGEDYLNEHERKQSTSLKNI